MSYHLPPVLCPKCGYSMDHHASVNGTKGRERRPEPGDIGICNDCGSTLVFGDDLRLRSPKEEELAALPKPLLEKLLMARLFRIANPRKPRPGEQKETRQ